MAVISGASRGALRSGRYAKRSMITAVITAIAVAVITAVIMERFAYRPLRNAPRLAPLITAIGVSIFLQEAVRVFYPGGKRQQAFPRLISGGTFEVAGV